MVSFTGILVNKEVTSKLTMTTMLESMLLFKSSWTKEKESVIMRELVVRGVNGQTTRHLHTRISEHLGAGISKSFLPVLIRMS